MRTVPFSFAQRSMALQSIDISLLESLFDGMSDMAFFIKDREGRYQTVNYSLLERHGFKFKSQVIGRRPCDISTGDFGRIPSQQDETVLRSGIAIHDHLELQWHTPNQPCWCLTTKLPILDSEGQVIGLIGVSRDVCAPIKNECVPASLAGVLEHFEAHLADAVSPSSLAVLAGMSPIRFARLMKRLFQLTPIQYITKHRINAASDLLRETTQSVSEIAIACGYYDHSAFTRTFRKLTGTSPTKFREEAIRVASCCQPNRLTHLARNNR